MLSTLRDHQDKDILAAVRGTNVYGTEDTKLGSVEDAIVNAESGELRYLIVNAGWLEKQFRRFAIPADQVYAYRDTDDLYVSQSKSEVEALPAFEDACVASENAFSTYEREYAKMPGVLVATQLICDPVSAYFGCAIASVILSGELGATLQSRSGKPESIPPLVCPGRSYIRQLCMASILIVRM